jgi:hypothetical protein
VLGLPITPLLDGLVGPELMKETIRLDAGASKSLFTRQGIDIRHAFKLHDSLDLIELR